MQADAHAFRHHDGFGLKRAQMPAPRRASAGRAQRGVRAHACGLRAENEACAALQRDGWTVRGRRLRTAAGEVDVAAEKDGTLALIEVKSRPTLAGAASALTTRQMQRLIAAADILLAEHPDWGSGGVRFDLMLMDATGALRRITDAFRAGI